MSAKFLEEKIATYTKEMQQIPELFNKEKRALDRKIDALCEEVGILTQVEALRNQIETTKTKLQQKADILSGRIQALREVHEHLYYAPIPEGVTHMHGLELSTLEPKTRLLVMSGKEETILALGGKLDVPETEEEKQEYFETTPKSWDFGMTREEKINYALDMYYDNIEEFKVLFENFDAEFRKIIQIAIQEEEKRLEESFEDYSEE